MPSNDENNSMTSTVPCPCGSRRAAKDCLAHHFYPCPNEFVSDSRHNSMTSTVPCPCGSRRATKDSLAHHFYSCPNEKVSDSRLLFMAKTMNPYVNSAVMAEKGDPCVNSTLPYPCGLRKAIKDCHGPHMVCNMEMLDCLSNC